jgi:phosphoribosylamine---glycine ligase
MKVLIIGSGGREHALAWALARSPQRPEVLGLPGNPGFAEVGTCLPADLAEPDRVLDLVRDQAVELVVIGPEAPLVAGLADALRAAGVRAFGPGAAAAALEGSKVFAKDLMQRHAIPTAAYQVVASAQEARALIERISYPHVFKADGLAAGKGALIIENPRQAAEAVEALMVRRAFGAAGDRVIFEEFLQGEEMSVFAIASGEQYVLMPPSQDYKRARDRDEGGNTGGMGAYAPVVCWNPALEEAVRRTVIEPTLHAMAAEGSPYSGLLYAGLMVTDNQPRVVEFNCRFGDPETQVVLPVTDGDLLDLLWRASDPQRKEALPPCGPDGRSAVCVVIASEGYPGPARTGVPITGIDAARDLDDVLLFHAGTRREEGSLINSGGRVLNVVGLGETLPRARRRAYEAVGRIRFDGAFHRGDIAWRGLEAIGEPLPPR